MSGLRYCEGFVALRGFPLPGFLHGWLVNEHGRVIDPSVEQDRDAVYYGVAFKTESAIQWWKILDKKGWIGILPNQWLLRIDIDKLCAGFENLSSTIDLNTKV